MARTLGIDHGTQAIRFCLLEDGEKKYLEIQRKPGLEESFINVLDKKGFLEVDLIGLTYSMGDGINKITDVKKVRNRGQLEPITGELSGLGTQLFDEILESKYNAVLIPGLHRKIGCLDERFKQLYSHMAASEKVALSYHAYNRINRDIQAKNILISDISSNTVTIGIKGGRFFGAIDACIGAPGLLHGPLDLGDIRRIDKGLTNANKAFYHSGISHKMGLSSSKIMEGGGEKEKLALEALIMAAKIEISGFSAILKPHAIAISGAAGISEKVFEHLKSDLEVLAPTVRLNKNAPSLGAAEIARDILDGKRDFLGIKTAS
jgi:putative methanogenesis marker protein 12